MIHEFTMTEIPTEHAKFPHEFHGLNHRFNHGLIKGIIPKWPYFRLVNYYHIYIYYNLPWYILLFPVLWIAPAVSIAHVPPALDSVGTRFDADFIEGDQVFLGKPSSGYHWPRHIYWLILDINGSYILHNMICYMIYIYIDRYIFNYIYILCVLSVDSVDTLWKTTAFFLYVDFEGSAAQTPGRLRCSAAHELHQW
jgi:hypothetical protein